MQSDLRLRLLAAGLNLRDGDLQDVILEAPVDGQWYVLPLRTSRPERECRRAADVAEIGPPRPEAVPAWSSSPGALPGCCLISGYGSS